MTSWHQELSVKEELDPSTPYITKSKMYNPSKNSQQASFLAQYLLRQVAMTSGYDKCLRSVELRYHNTNINTTLTQFSCQNHLLSTGFVSVMHYVASIKPSTPQLQKTGMGIARSNSSVIRGGLGHTPLKNVANWLESLQFGGIWQ